jgi:hypothetical protein
VYSTSASTLIGLYGGREDNTFYRRGPGGIEVA